MTSKNYKWIKIPSHLIYMVIDDTHDPVLVWLEEELEKGYECVGALNYSNSWLFKKVNRTQDSTRNE